MMHAKKMILVPHESIEKLENEKPQAPAPVGSFSKMDEEMHNILHEKNLDEFDKYAKYEQVLQRYMSKMNRTGKDIEFFVDEEIEEEGAEADFNGINLGEPKKRTTHFQKTPHLSEYKSASKNIKARLLFNLLSKTNSVDVDNEGGLHVDGEVIGHVADLIDASLTARNVKHPEGWGEFQTLMRKINLPVSYVTNLDLKKFIKSNKTLKKSRTDRNTRSVKWSAYNGSSR